MTTLATLKTEIADDLGRSDLTDAIADAITAAIAYYQKENLFFKENHTASFSTVADQVYYSSSDDSDIGNVIDLDAVLCRISNNDYTLTPLDIHTFEVLNDANVSSGAPSRYVWHAEQVGLYPPPDTVYTVYLIGSFKVAAPASDSEADNDWMTEGYELIRARAVSQLAKFKTQDFELSAIMQAAANEQLDDLRVRTARLHATNRVMPSQF